MTLQCMWMHEFGCNKKKILVRYVEDALLQRVDAIRERWLIFDSFRKAHSEARIKTEQLVRMACETFEKVCGSEKGLDLWRYASVRTLERGQVGKLHSKLLSFLGFFLDSHCFGRVLFLMFCFMPQPLLAPSKTRRAVIYAHFHVRIPICVWSLGSAAAGTTQQHFIRSAVRNCSRVCVRQNGICSRK